MGGDGGISGCIEVEVGWQSAAAAAVVVVVAVAGSAGVEDVEEKVPRLEADHDVLPDSWVAAGFVPGFGETGLVQRTL